MTRRQLVIVGAGPAGMSAAIAAVQAGLRPTVIDECARPGGQIYRQAPAAFRPESVGTAPGERQHGAALHRRFAEVRNRIDFLHDTTVWGVFPPKQLAITDGTGWQLLEAERVVLAPGAYEYVPPFPGWTLPGVMTPGAAQFMVKTMRIRPGRRVLLGGTGPFLLVVACALHEAGVEVVGVVEAVRRREVFRVLPRLLSSPELLRQGRDYLGRLKNAGVPLYLGHVIVEARGSGHVGSVAIAPCETDWRPDRSRVHTIDADTLCVGYGFIPRTELAQMAGCRMRYVREHGGWTVEVDDTQESTAPGIWVAGDGGGVSGALVAELEGELAGVAAARSLNAIDAPAFDQTRRSVSKQLAKLRRFRAGLDRITRFRPGLLDLADDDTVVCRCEELSRAEVADGIEAGGTDIRTLKVITRVGMGPCQGRMCWPTVARHIAARTGKPIQDIGPSSVRPPIGGITVGTLAEASRPLPGITPVAAGVETPT